MSRNPNVARETFVSGVAAHQLISAHHIFFGSVTAGTCTSREDDWGHG